MSFRFPVLAAVAGVVALTAAGCADGAAGGSEDGLSVVASTSTWASVVRAVGGEHVTATALIEDPVADPHSYESTAEDALRFTKADLAVINGGGYDAFAEGLAEDSPAPVVNAVELSQHALAVEQDHDHGHDHATANEHVWYDLDTVEAVAEAVAEELGKLEPDQASAFQSNREKFVDGLDELRKELAAVATAADGAKVISTEPVAFYLLEAAGLRDVTPRAFSNAIEGDTDVPVAAQAEVTRQLESGKVAAVVNNPQTQTDVTRQLVSAAKKAKTPVVEVGETLPEGQADFLRWVGSQVAELKAAVANA